MKQFSVSSRPARYAGNYRGGVNNQCYCNHFKACSRDLFVRQGNYRGGDLIAEGVLMESSNGMSQGQDTISSPGTEAAAPSTGQESTPQERSFRQSEVNDIVKKAKHSAVEDYRRLSSEQPQYAQQKYGDSPYRQQPQQPVQANLPETDVRRMAAEEAQRLRDEWVKDAQMKSESERAQRTVQNFVNKISQGKDKYQDFDKAISDLDMSRFPHVVEMLADHVDNSHDLLYNLAQDRFKLDSLERLAERSPRDAIVQAQRLSQSIKDNEQAGKIRIPNAPLDQLRPSNTGTDNGVMSVKDYRSKYRV